jgi:hypothetical protein
VQCASRFLALYSIDPARDSDESSSSRADLDGDICASCSLPRGYDAVYTLYADSMLKRCGRRRRSASPFRPPQPRYVRWLTVEYAQAHCLVSPAHRPTRLPGPRGLELSSAQRTWPAHAPWCRTLHNRECPVQLLLQEAPAHETRDLTSEHCTTCTTRPPSRLYPTRQRLAGVCGGCEFRGDCGIIRSQVRQRGPV